MPLLSGDTFRLFMDASSDLFSGWDVAWIGFAIYTAWRIPQGRVRPVGLRAPGRGAREAKEKATQSAAHQGIGHREPRVVHRLPIERFGA